MLELPRPFQESEGGACIPSVVAKGGNSTAIVIGQEFEIQEGTTASRKAGENRGPVRLTLVTMRKLNVVVD